MPVHSKTKSHYRCIDRSRLVNYSLDRKVHYIIDTSMSDHAEETAGGGGLLSSAWSMGAAAWNYASQTVTKYVVHACVVQFGGLGRDCLSTVAWRRVVWIEA
jgi:hypothetical protein